MSTPGFAMGVDLGTSNTVAVVRWPDGRTRPLLADGAPVLPSAVYLDEQGRLHVGRDAERLARIEPARFEPNPKRRVDESAVLLGDREIRPADLLAAVLGAVARSAVEAVGFLPPAVLTHPAAWGARRREVLSEAAVRAGWPPPRLVPEPVGAARYFVDVLRRPVPVGAALAVFDFGGGTVDVAVLRNDDGRFVVLGSGGLADLGGLDIDAALVEYLGRTIAHTRPEVWAALSDPGDPAARRDRRLFWDDVRAAKEMLSRAAVAPITVPGLDAAVHLTRDELEAVAAPLLRRAVHETAAVIARCGLRPDALVGMFLVGGSSRLPLAARMLHAELGVAPTVLEQPELPVAEGAIAELWLPPTEMGSGPVHPGPPVGAPQSGPPWAAGAPQSGPPGAVGLVGAPQSGPPWIASGPPASAAPAAFPAAYGAPRPGRTPRAGRRRLLLPLVAAAVVAILAVATGAAVWWLRRESPVEFAGLEPAGVEVPFGDGNVDATASHTVGDRAYLAWQFADRVELAAVDLAKRRQLWHEKVSAGARRFEVFAAAPQGVVLLTGATKDTDARPMHVLDPDTGRQRWQADVLGGDRAFLFESALVIQSDAGDAVRALDWRTGEQRWQLGHRTSTSGPLRTATIPASAGVDRGGPAAFSGAPFAARAADDARLVQLDSDRVLRVIEVGSGRVREQTGVGTADDLMLADGGTLYLVVRDNGVQLRRYDLSKAGAPVVPYTQTDAARRPIAAPQPCGTDRICLLEQAGSDAKSTEVVAIDVKKRSVLWRRPAPGTDLLLALGGAVLATNVDSTPASALFDGDGRQLLKAGDVGTAGVRLDSSSVLLFSQTPSTYPTTVALTGVTTTGGRTPLGSLDRVRTASCSWSTRYLTCGAEDGFRTWRFASE